MNIHVTEKLKKAVYGGIPTNRKMLRGVLKEKTGAGYGSSKIRSKPL